MKATAFATAALIFLLSITSGTSYFNLLTREEEKNVFAYSNAYQDINIQMKPLSQGDSLNQREKDMKVKLMTYNIHRGISKYGKLDLNAAAEIINASGVGIVALQEVERYSIRTAFQDQIKQLSQKTDMNFAYGKSINVLNGDYGNGLLSRYPIEEYEVYDLPSFSEQRTVLRTVVNIEGLRLAVYNTHLGLKASERKEQLDFILQMTSQEKLDYVLMGDMNSSVEKLKAVTISMKDSAEVSEKQQQSTFEEKGMQERIDYIFVSPNMEVIDYDVVASEASDHYPVVSEIILDK